MQHRMRIMNRSGDSTVVWETDEEAERVKSEFDRLVNEGHLAYRVDGPGKGTMLREFDPLAKEIVLHGPIVGG